MEWFFELLSGESVAHAVLVFGVVAVLGLALGKIRVFGINMGIAGVLFAGLILGHFRFHVNNEVLEFVREFGLILFVYSIGIQVGPGILASLRREGLPLNLMAAAIVGMGAVITVLLVKWADIPAAVASGLFSGATTNTPSLAAAQAALKSLPGYTEEIGKLPGLGYAVAYPFGILGIILTMILVRVMLRIDRAKEAALFGAGQAGGVGALERMSIEINNPNIEGMKLADLALLNTSDLLVSRILHDKEISLATPDTELHQGDVILAVGLPHRLEQLQAAVGRQVPVDLMGAAKNITTRRLAVTRKSVLGKTVEELDFLDEYGVRITRLRRAELEFAAMPHLKFQYGDTVLAVGTAENIDKVAKVLGNSTKKLGQPELLPLFLGIILGVLVGSCPIHVPGMPAPLKLGLAGGPLLVAIILSRIGHIGPLVWYLPGGANLMIRELGIVLFLGCVGLKSGDRFVETLTHGDGIYWMAMATMITLVPILVVGFFARLFLKINYMSICGLLSGSMTDPPALAFACSMNDSTSPMVAYASVYPLTMVLRVLLAQILVFLLAGG